MAIAFGGALGSNTTRTTGTTVTLTTGSAVPIGALVVVVWAADNLTATTPTLSSVTDTKSNTYSVIANVGSGTATAAAGQVAGIAVSKLTTALTATDTISAVASSASTVVKVVDAAYFTGAEITTRAAATTATGNSTAPSVNYTAGLAGDLLIGVVANQDNAVPTGDTDTTNGSWNVLGGVNSSGGGGATSQIAVYSQYKILTASGSQTYNVTIASGQWSIAAVAVKPTPVTLQRTATGSGAGTQSVVDVLTAKRTAANSVTGTQTAVKRTIKRRTSFGSGLGTQTVVGARKISRTATASGAGTETAIATRRVVRTATGSGLGTATITSVSGRIYRATGSGLGTQTGYGHNLSRLKWDTTFGYATSTQTASGRRRFALNTSGSFDSAGDSVVTISDHNAATTQTSATGIGQSFLGNGEQLAYASFHLGTTTTLPTSGTVQVVIYTHTGQYGVNGRVGYPIARSDTLPYTIFTTTTRSWRTFTFSGNDKIILKKDTPYVAVVTHTLNQSLTTTGVSLTTAAINLSRVHSGNGMSVNLSTGIATPSTTADWSIRIGFTKTFGRVIAASKSVTATDIGRGSETTTHRRTKLSRTAFDYRGNGEFAERLSLSYPYSLVGQSADTYEGISFLGNGAQLTFVNAYLGANALPTNGSWFVRLYATKVLGSGFSAVTTNVLATSDEIPYTAVTSTTNKLYTFAFTGTNKITLVKNQPYVAVVVNTSTTTYTFQRIQQSALRYFPTYGAAVSSTGNATTGSSVPVIQIGTTATTNRVIKRKTANGSGTGDGTATPKQTFGVVRRTATASGAGTQTTTSRRTLKRSASGAGTGTQTTTRTLTSKRSATGSGTGTQTALKLHRSPRTASGAGIGTQTAAKLHRSPRTASGAGTGSQTAAKLHRSPRTATGAGTGTETTSRLVTRVRNANASGIGSGTALKRRGQFRTALVISFGTQTAVGKHTVIKTASGAGSGTSTNTVRKSKARYATGAGVGAGSADTQLTHRATANGAGVGTASVASKATHLVVATASATGGSFNSIRKGIYRNAQGAGGATTGDHATVLLTAKRVAVGSGVGYGVADDQLTHTKTANGSGAGAATVQQQKTALRTADGAGNGTASTTEKIVTFAVIERTADGAGVGSATVVGLHKHQRAGFPSTAFGTQSTISHVIPHRTGLGVGGGSETSTRLVHSRRQSSSSGSGASFCAVRRTVPRTTVSYGVGESFDTFRFARVRLGVGSGVGTAFTDGFKRLEIHTVDGAVDANGAKFVTTVVGNNGQSTAAGGTGLVTVVGATGITEAKD